MKKTVTPPAPVGEPGEQVDPLAAELEAARAELDEAIADLARLNAFQPQGGALPVELRWRRPPYEAPIPHERYTAAVDRKAEAARRLADLEAAQRTANEQAATAARRQAAADLIDAAADELGALETRLGEAARAHQATGAALRTAAAQYDAVRRLRAAEIARAEVWAVGDDGADGATRDGGLRLRGHWHLPVLPSIVLEWISWRLAPRTVLMTSPNAAVRAVSRGSWAALVPEPPPFDHWRPALVKRDDIRDVVGPTAFQVDRATGELVPTSPVPQPPPEPGGAMARWLRNGGVRPAEWPTSPESRQ